MNDEKIKTMVREKYSQIAGQSREKNQSSCCGTTSCCGGSEGSEAIFAPDYTGEEGYHPDADLGLGCGMPLSFAKIKEGDTVVDLGSGAGNDAFIARRHVGETGRVIGVDMTPTMIEKARANNAKVGYGNVEFLLGEIEHLPVRDNVVDLVISNCVINLVPDKKRAFLEIFRILKPGGSFCVSDIVTEGNLPDSVKKIAELYAGCVGGALTKEAYLNIVTETGYTDIRILSDRVIDIPEEMLIAHLQPAEIAEIKKSGVIIRSVTIEACKPF